MRTFSHFKQKRELFLIFNPGVHKVRRFLFNSSMTPYSITSICDKNAKFKLLLIFPLKSYEK